MRLSEIEPGQKRKIGPHDPKLNFDHIWNKLIVPNCSLSVESCRIAEKLMYRGFNSSQPVVRGMSHRNRVPLDSDEELSARFDMFLKKLGFTALRSNSIFVTSNFITAKYFGTPYIIFPINGYDYTYTAYMDLTFNPESKVTLGNDWMTNDDLAVFRDEFKPQNKQIAHAIENGLEICIHGQYYALKYDIYGEDVARKLTIGLPK